MVFSRCTVHGVVRVRLCATGECPTIASHIMYPALLCLSVCLSMYFVNLPNRLNLYHFHFHFSYRNSIYCCSTSWARPFVSLCLVEFFIGFVAIIFPQLSTKKNEKIIASVLTCLYVLCWVGFWDDI